MNVIMLHGRGQEHLDSDKLRANWIAALEVGLEHAKLVLPKSVEFVCPFYGALLQELVQEYTSGTNSSAAVQKGDAKAQVDKVQVALLHEIANQAGIADAKIQESAKQIAVEKGVVSWPPFRALLKALDEAGHGSQVITHLTQDVSLYLTVPAIAQRIEKHIAQQVGEVKKALVISHSLGTVVAYKMLRSGLLAQAKDFITLGSPLGLQTIRQHLIPPALAVPVNVVRWRNAFDREDVVAVRPLDETTWAVNPAIENFGGVANHTANSHGISGYLDDPTVARWIAEAVAE